MGRGELSAAPWGGAAAQAQGVCAGVLCPVRARFALLDDVHLSAERLEDSVLGHLLARAAGTHGGGAVVREVRTFRA